MVKMRKSFIFKGNKYSWIPFEKFDISKLHLSDKVFAAGYLNIGCAFDIETTSYYSKNYNKDLATMYIWQLSLNKDTIMGRTWEEFKELMNILSDYAGSKEGKLLCMVHNLSFEFQFFKGVLDWDIKENGHPDIFAKDDRTILYAKYKNIEFRDTLALTSMGLVRLQKNYGLDIGKLNGDLDYSMMRHYRTPVTDQERAYCINDVQVLSDFFYKYLVPEYLRIGEKIPLTSTGEVRCDIKKEFNELPKEVKKKLRNRIRNAQPSEAVYKFWRNYLFRGGLVHAQTALCNYASDEGFDSYDLKSAHPSHMLQDKFPWKFSRRDVKQFDKVLEKSREGNYGFWGVFKFYNITCKGFHSLESKNKVIESSLDAVYENGRLVFASYIKVALIDLDWLNYEDMYVWDKFECTVLYEAPLEVLPDYVRKPLCKYFVIKESLPEGPERNKSKRRLNGIFGMAATSLPEREVVFNPSSNVMELSENEKTYKELIQFLIMLPQWSIYTAAYTRRDIVKSIIGCSEASEPGCGADSVYYDTDSNKILNPSEHEAFFEEFNKEKILKNKQMEIYGNDPKIFERLGCFEKEYSGTRWKVLGCKRYLVTHDGKTQVTIAGCVKDSFEKYVDKLYRKENGIEEDELLTLDQEKEYEDKLYEMFTDDLTLPASDSDKKTTVYTDFAFDDVLKDYNGVMVPIHEESCVAIIDIPFTMSIEEEFLSRINALSKERERMIYKGVL